MPPSADTPPPDDTAEPNAPAETPAGPSELRLDDATLTVLRGIAHNLSATHQAFVDREAALYDAYRATARGLAGLLRLIKHPALDLRLFDDQVDAADLALLDALNRGVQVENLPRLLRITRHNAKNRQRELYRVTGTETLFQLGRAAAARGWVPLDPGAASLPGPRPR